MASARGGAGESKHPGPACASAWRLSLNADNARALAQPARFNLSHTAVRVLSFLTWRDVGLRVAAVCK